MLIAEVVVKGVEGELKDIVYKTVQAKPGGRTSKSELQKDVDAVFKTGFFTNINAVLEDGRVTFNVQSNPVLRHVEVVLSKGNAIIPSKVVTDIFSQQYGTILNLNNLQEGINKVNKWYYDKGTSILMTKFYNKMLKDGLSPTIALREAQLEMWRSSQWQAPYYWSAFVIQGNAK